jgi:hypothetical protein
MRSVEEIEKVVANLSPEELAKFREWFASYDAELWDRQLEKDVSEGKLDRFATEALAEHRRGETRDL